MTSLSEVYTRDSQGADRRRLVLGILCFAVGAAAVLAGIVVAATELSSVFGLGWAEARVTAGVLGGLGVPIAAIGLLVILPGAGRLVRLGAVLGALISLLSLVGFTLVYPENWLSGTPSYALPVTVTYFVGSLVTLWSLLAGIANFKTRNDPGGTVKLEITKEGRTKIVEVQGRNLSKALGGVGFLGSQPDGEAKTQTGSSSSTHPAMRRKGRQATDGGSSTVHAEVTHAPQPTQPGPATDPYCGNCSHFRYVRTDDGLTPYCGFNRELMDDMEPCDDWQANT